MQITRGLPVLALLGLAACAQPQTPPVAHGFPESEARHVFSSGFRFIAERYVDPIPTERLALAGMQRLTELAPDVAISRADTGLQVAVTGRPTAEFRVPDGGDSVGWARLTAAALHTAWNGSPALRQNPPDALFTAVFQGAVSRLDGYSRYIDPRRADDDRAAREGFGGIGVKLKTEDGRAIVESVTPNAPAARAGLRDGDEILAIDGIAIASIDRSEIARHLRGEEGSSVRVDIRRAAQAAAFAITIRREHVVPQSVYLTRDGDVALIRLDTFNAGTKAEMQFALETLRRQPRPAGIVLDLRNNPGGRLDQAIGVADLLLDQGTILTLRGRHPLSSKYHVASGRDMTGGLPLVVLVNGRSASASEMVAATLQDLGRGVVVGSTTYGKGSVQNVEDLPNGGELIVTWARMHAPSGYIIDRLGVLPGVCTSDQRVDPLEFRRGGRADLSPAFLGWHRYDRVDPVQARTLRANCPPDEASRADDMMLAKRLLRDGPTYADSLRPAGRQLIAQQRPNAGGDPTRQQAR